LDVTWERATIKTTRGEPAAAADGKKTFTILHTNDLHSSLIGIGPA
jgi:5'-nucleotidase